MSVDPQLTSSFWVSLGAQFMGCSECYSHLGGSSHLSEFSLQTFSQT